MHAAKAAEYSIRRQSPEVATLRRQALPSTGVKSSSFPATPVAIGRLDNGIDVELLVEIGDEAPKYLPSVPDAKATLVFCSSVPVLSDLRKRLYAEQYIRQHGRFVWRYQPDVFGLVDAAMARLRSHAAADNASAERIQKRQAEEAALRWAQARERLREQTAQQPISSAIERKFEAPQVAVPARSATEAGEPQYAWAPQRKPNTSFVFYRMKDGAAWVIYTLNDGSSAIAVWPRAEEGWDEALPELVGTADTAWRLPHQEHDRRDDVLRPALNRCPGR